MIDADAILRTLAEAERERLDCLEIFSEIGSTNTHLLNQPGPRPGHFRVAIAEHQTSGRGRRGTIWISPQEAGLYLSLSFTFAATPHNLPSLTLAVGVGIALALQTLGVDDVALKWPNDIVARAGKLGGILTEVPPRGVNGQTVVVGVGVNVDLARPVQDEIPVKWANKVTDLKECIGDLPSRPALYSGILQCLFSTITRFASDGFSAFHTPWTTYDWLKGKSVLIEQPAGQLFGIADGVDTDGALLLKTTTGRQRIVSGSVITTDPSVACA